MFWNESSPIFIKDIGMPKGEGIATHQNPCNLTLWKIIKLQGYKTLDETRETTRILWKIIKLQGYKTAKVSNIRSSPFG